MKREGKHTLKGLRARYHLHRRGLGRVQGDLQGGGEGPGGRRGQLLPPAGEAADSPMREVEKSRDSLVVELRDGDEYKTGRGLISHLERSWGSANI